ncbi:putative beta-lysine N-acetyltransferase (plasmid) [Cytobacillus spongiae]|uniref:putative beta-lysine N-acetyltransferase n=1 Tax=Cytobacillus spongiae TaxID=2901381 RepID=UPI00145E9E02|nr:putative beta-lysine N-acetyltransferase [Cytobacillus spongiae]NMH70399.1 putative beta-lysine N-acetyltransferase [Bacillus sp. RO3]UII58656.1 putative beta-lysine N-acetyltransferase [Cytobacillus spongiae]
MQTYEYIKQPKLEAVVYKDEYNRRLRVDEFRGNAGLLWEYIKRQTGSNLYEKVIIKSKWDQSLFFLERGFILEGGVKGYFDGDRVLFLSNFLTNERRNSSYWRDEDVILQTVQALESHEVPCSKPISVATEEHVSQLADLYREVFKLYPVPLHNPEYVKQSMESGTIFVYIEENGRIISAASAEVSSTWKNAELTDCATRTSHRKGGYMKHLIRKLEAELQERNIYCAYTIARALSFGMNAVFQQLGYRYGGRLANNCIIFDKMEDMNIWQKDLSEV